MAPRHLAAIALWLALAPAPVSTPARAETPFYLTAVDTLRRTGLHTSLALGPDGEPWIAYYDATTGDLKVAHRQLGRWSVETVDPRGFTGAYPSLVVDATGTPFVAYMAELFGDLRFAWREPGGWRRETVDSRPHNRAFSSLDLGPDGVPRFAHYNFTLQQLLVAERAGGTWVQEVVDAGFHHGLFPSLVSATDGTLYLSYLDGQYSDLRLALRDHGAWSIETIDSTGNFGPHTAVRLDRQGRPRVSYFDLSEGELRVAHKEAGSWRFETVDTLSSDARNGSLALDASDGAWIAYTAGSGGGLRLARPLDGGWTSETVDLETGTYASIALDAEMNPRISYYDTTRGDLRFADAAVHLLEPLGGLRWAAGSAQEVRWEGRGRTRLELSPDGGTSYVPVAEAADGSPLAFVVPEWTTERGRFRLVRDDPVSTRESPGRFEIAPDLVSPWWSESVDTEGHPGRFAALVVTGDAPRVAYRAAADGALRLARRDDSGWSRTRLGPASSGEGRVSLAIDRDGRARVATAEGPSRQLVFLEETPSGWRTESLPYAAPAAIALDRMASGAPAIAYYDAAGELHLTTRGDGGWTDERIAPTGEASDALDLAVDELAGPRVAFYDDAQGRLRLAERVGDTWSLRTLPGVSLLPSRVALRLDAAGRPHIAVSSANAGSVVLFEWDGAFWLEQTVVGPGVAGEALGFSLDASGEPWVAYGEVATGRPWIARRQAGVWTQEPMDDGGRIGSSLALALDGDGRARVAYFDLARAELRYVSSAVEFDGFEPLATWPAGAEREVRWRGTGRVAAEWRDTTGASVGALGSAIGGSLAVRAPAAGPLVLALRREVPGSTRLAGSPVRFTQGVRLDAWRLDGRPDRGVRLTWSTQPAASDLGGFRLERRAAGDEWRLLAEALGDTSYEDLEGTFGARYRLSVVDLTGARHELGERAFLPDARLTVWPSPWRQGPLVLGLRSTEAVSTSLLAIHSVDGRRVRLLMRGALPAGERVVEWDGRDEAGRSVAPGVYFVEWRFGAERETRTLVKLR